MGGERSSQTHRLSCAVIGLGRMGSAVARRMHNDRHTVYGYDLDAHLLEEAAKNNIFPLDNLKQAAEKASVIWLMVPAGKAIDVVLEQILPHLSPGQIIVDGGNSNPTDTRRRAALCEKHKVAFVDCGTSGGIDGGELGFSLMIGGEQQAFQSLVPLFESLAFQRIGFCHTGPSGSGHYVKMVHNGIEYALLQAYAEGIHLLHDGHYKDLDLGAITKVWQDGSVIRSWINQLAHEVLSSKPNIDRIPGAIGENQTGRWTSDEGKKYSVPLPTIDASLDVRAWSRETGGNMTTQLVALLRKRFGGHPLETATTKKESS